MISISQTLEMIPSHKTYYVKTVRLIGMSDFTRENPITFIDMFIIKRNIVSSKVKLKLINY